MTPFTNSIIHADCIKALPMLPDNSVNFILTDPPYITNYKSRDGRRVPNDDNDKWLKPAFAQMHRVLANDSFAVSFYGWPQADKFMQAYRAAGFRVVGHMMFPKPTHRAPGSCATSTSRHTCLLRAIPASRNSPSPT